MAWLYANAPVSNRRDLCGAGHPGQAVDLTFPVMADDRIVTGQVNNSLALATPMAEDPRMIFDDVLIRINAQDGAPLANSDAFYASQFSVTLDRPHEAPFVTNRKSTRSEPIANGKPTIRIALTRRCLRQRGADYRAAVTHTIQNGHRRARGLVHWCQCDVQIPVPPGVPWGVLVGGQLSDQWPDTASSLISRWCAEQVSTAPPGYGTVSPIR